MVYEMWERILDLYYWLADIFSREKIVENSDLTDLSLEPDGIPWEFEARGSSVFSIGDVHGDLGALAAILLDRNLIDKKGRWTGGPSHLVLNGDLAGDSSDARLVIEFIMRIEEEARAENGCVHALLGNHDIKLLHKKKTKNSQNETLFKAYPVEGAKGQSIKEAFCGNTHIARWLRSRNSIVKIGTTIYSHAGLNNWALHHHPERINATIRAWIRFWQGVDKQPARETSWVSYGPYAEWETKSTGPMWTRSYKPVLNTGKNYIPAKQTNAPDLQELITILSHFDAERMVIGHTPVSTGKILLSHPYYQESVIMIDTRISDKKKGRLSCLEIRGNEPDEPDELKAWYPGESKNAEKVQNKELKRLKNKAKKV